MKADIHPNYRDVVFHDVTSHSMIQAPSTTSKQETIAWEDRAPYSLVRVEICTASPPF